jgi:pimeloyl-ACP methyl ester carboxylesterase
VLRFLTASSGPVAVLVAEPTVPIRGTVLMVPGYTGSKEDFAPILVPVTAAGFRVVAMDLPGQYQSPGPDRREAYTVDWLGSVVDEVAATVDDAPVHLLGHSFGGLVARAALLMRPQRYRSLVLLCSGPAGIDGARRERMDRLEVVAPQGLSAVWAAIEAEDPAAAAAPEAVFLRERFLSCSLAGLLGMGDALRDEPDRVAPVRETGVPALVCFGVDDDAWPPAVQRDMAHRLGARLAVIDGAAEENPAATAAALIDFWAAR